MTALDLVVPLARKLNQADIAWMFVGSVALHYWEIIDRLPADLDVVVERTVGLSAALRPEFEFQDMEPGGPHEFARLVFRCFGIQANFCRVGDDPLSRSAWSRRMGRTVYGQTVWLSSPEDLAIRKRQLVLEKGRERDREDLRRLLERRGEGLDRDYILRHVKLEDG